MNYQSIHATTTVTVPDHRNLIAAWNQYGAHNSLVGSYVVHKPLTASQCRRLPAELRQKLRTEAD